MASRMPMRDIRMSASTMASTAPNATDVNARLSVSGTPLSKLQEGVPHEGEIHQEALLMPRSECVSARWKR